MQPKNNVTLQQRMGFRDTDLTTPGHDAICIALLQSDVQDNLVRKLKISRVSVHEEWKSLAQEKKDKLLDDYTDSFKTWHRNDLNFSSVKLEHPIMTEKKFIIGFIDAMLYFVSPSLGFERSYSVSVWKYNLDKPDIDYLINKVAIEVKTTIRSFGETLRQLELYKAHLGGKTIVLITAEETPFKKAFNSQGYYVFSASEIGITT
jgi:hypothetical protein